MLEDIRNAIIKGNYKNIEQFVINAIQNGYSPHDIINNALLKGMEEVGVKFKSGQVFIPEVLASAKAMKTAMNTLRPYIKKETVKPIGKFIIGAVKNDLHDIGTTLVAIMFESNGFEVKHLGVDVSAEKFIEEIKQYSPDIVGLSALLTTTMLNMKLTIQKITEAGLRDKVKIMVGGAPVTQEFADEIGADGYAPDAVSAVEKAKALLGIR